MNVRDDYASLLRGMLSPNWQKPSDRKIEVLLKKIADAQLDEPSRAHPVTADRQQLVHLVTARTRLHEAAALARAAAYDIENNIENSGVKLGAVMLMARADIAKKCDEAITRLDRAIAEVSAP